jgi:4-diphosphocytidyl-2-C-methyl-D-erythritol kinase
MMFLEVRVPAKINLHLQVLGRRPDGFHEVRTLLQSIDLFDVVRAAPAPEGVLELRVEPPDAVSSGEENLVLKAARRLWQESGTRPGAALWLRKRIPLGAGLGGGSADAAATLVLLDRLWSLRLGPVALHAAAADLGSDVPFFLRGGSALGVGRGEEVLPLPDLPKLGVLVVFPGQLVPTAEVYGRLEQRLTWDAPEATVYAFAAGLTGPPRWSDLRNDLQPTVVAGWPAVADALRQIEAGGPRYWAVTGSGGAVFGLFDSPEAAASAASEGGGQWQHVGATLEREQAALSVRECDE